MKITVYKSPFKRQIVAVIRNGTSARQDLIHSPIAPRNSPKQRTGRSTTTDLVHLSWQASSQSPHKRTYTDSFYSSHVLSRLTLFQPKATLKRSCKGDDFSKPSHLHEGPNANHFSVTFLAQPTLQPRLDSHRHYQGFPYLQMQSSLISSCI